MTISFLSRMTGNKDWANPFAMDLVRFERKNTGTIQIQFDGGAAGSNIADTTTSIDDGEWHLMTLTLDKTGNEARFYMDGVQDGATTAYSLDATAVGFVMGTRWGSRTLGTDSLGSTIDDVPIYNTALTAAEVAALPIPEPATMSLLALGGLALLRRRRA